MTLEPVTLDSIRWRATIPLWPDAAQVLGLSRARVYASAKDGSLPVLRFGRRIVVSVPALITMLEAGANTDADA